MDVVAAHPLCKFTYHDASGMLWQNLKADMKTYTPHWDSRLCDSDNEMEKEQFTHIQGISTP